MRPMLTYLYSRPRWLAWLLLAVSASPLALALLSQYGFGLHPCELCIWQRYPYGALIVIALIAVVWPKPIRFFLLVSAVLWLIEGGLAVYHVGVEQHWWQSASGCTAGGAAGQSLDALRAQIMGAALVACDQPEFVLFGVSMAGWNVVYSLAMLLVLGVILRQWKDER